MTITLDTPLVTARPTQGHQTKRIAAWLNTYSSAPRVTGGMWHDDDTDTLAFGLSFASRSGVISAYGSMDYDSGRTFVMLTRTVGDVIVARTAVDTDRATVLTADLLNDAVFAL